MLEKGQSEILKELSEALDQGRLKAAAEIMEKEQETLVSLIYETMDGQRYLWMGKC